MKKFFLVAALLVSVGAWANGASEGSSKKYAGNAGNFTIGLGPVGNFYFTNRRPEMNAGVGAHIYFDYRWSPELSTTASIEMLVQNGKDRDAGENNIVFMGIPTFDINYYFLTNPSRWDPYASVGVGYYVLTNGSRTRGMSSGVGAQIGGGVHYYISTKLSAGVAAQFRSIAMLGGGATGTFPLSLLGKIGYHF